MMKCQVEKNDIVLFLFDELDGTRKAVVEKHINSCIMCQNTLSEWQRALQHYDNAPEKEPPVFKFAQTKKHSNSWGSFPIFQEFTFGAYRYAAIFIFAVVALIMSWILQSRASDMWSLENSWDSPGQQTLLEIRQKIEHIENDPFFATQGE